MPAINYLIIYLKMGHQTGLFRFRKRFRKARNWGWIPWAFLAEMQCGSWFCKRSAGFAIIKQVKCWLYNKQKTPYFYIIKQRSRRREGKRRWKAPTRSKASHKKDLTFFFIWQAIVRGQLFLQWTFFYFRPPSAGWIPQIMCRLRRLDKRIQHCHRLHRLTQIISRSDFKNNGGHLFIRKNYN